MCRPTFMVLTRTSEAMGASGIDVLEEAECVVLFYSLYKDGGGSTSTCAL